MMLYPVKSKMILVGDNLTKILLDSMNKQNISLLDNDVIAVSAKVISLSNGYLIKYRDIPPSKKSREIARITGLEASFVEAVLNEADLVLGYDYKAVLTIKNDILVINAGLDRKNVPPGFAAKWPDDPDQEARSIREEILKLSGVDVAVIIIDSKIHPMRRGTVGFALGISGLKASIDLRGKHDLFGKQLQVTWYNIADDVASAAHLLMGETVEMVPFVLIRGLPKKYIGKDVSRTVAMNVNKCIYMKNIISK